MNYCPRCGTRLEMKMEGGRERPSCPAQGCGFFFFGDSSIGCGAVVMRDGRALLIQRGIEPNRGAWQLPGGYAECDERIVSAVEREVLEEAGVVARVLDLVGFRHMAGRYISGAGANIYLVFRLEPVSGEPRYDGIETLGAGYFSQEEMARMERVQGLSLWAIERALKVPLGRGLVADPEGLTVGVARAGSALFGAALPGGPLR